MKSNRKFYMPKR